MKHYNMYWVVFAVILSLDASGADNSSSPSPNDPSLQNSADLFSSRKQVRTNILQRLRQKTGRLVGVTPDSTTFGHDTLRKVFNITASDSVKAESFKKFATRQKDAFVTGITKAVQRVNIFSKKSESKADGVSQSGQSAEQAVKSESNNQSSKTLRQRVFEPFARVRDWWRGPVRRTALPENLRNNDEGSFA